MRNPIDAIVGFINPVAGVKRAQARQVMGYYEAAKPSRLRKFRRDQGGPNTQTQQGHVAIRTQARHADQNHDIARGVLDTLVNNTVGAKGIEIEPQPRLADGTIDRDYARALLREWRDWTRSPEVTGQHHWGRVQRLMARTWLRDGEGFAQKIIGRIAGLNHGTRVPFSIEMLEPDMVPFDYTDLARGIRQGIQTNAWNRPVGYWVYKTHPHDSIEVASVANLKNIPAANMIHVANIDRIGQVRGMSIFASVINRLEDIKDYEESERVAAKIAAMLTAYVKRNHPDGVDPETLPKDDEGNITPREVGFEPGAIIDTLQVGEEIELIDSKRPNPNLVGFRHGQLKALAAGTRTTASSISKTYEGSYSAQRQEMVENWANYAALADEFVGAFIRPIWEAFVRAADISGVVPRPPEIDERDADDALYLGQAMPWIDPAKEAKAWRDLVKAGFASEVEVIRKRGGNPTDVMEQIRDWREQADEAGLTFDSNAGPGVVEREQMEAAAALTGQGPAASESPGRRQTYAQLFAAMDRRHEAELDALEGASEEEIDAAMERMLEERKSLIGSRGI